jgi:hypothetical protein
LIRGVAFIFRIRRKRRQIHVQLHFLVDLNLAEFGPSGSFSWGSFRSFSGECAGCEDVLRGVLPFFNSLPRSSTKFSNRAIMARARSSSIPLRSIFRIGSSRTSILAVWGEFSAAGLPWFD